MRSVMGSMYMSTELLNQTLLSTGYKKFWPVKSEEELREADRQRRLDQQQQKVRRPRSEQVDVRGRRRRELQNSQVIVCSAAPKPLRRVASQEDMVSFRGFSKLDPSTLHSLGWASGAVDDGQNNDTGLDEDEQLFKMTKVEFRKLQEQVRDVSINLRNKFRTSAYQLLCTREITFEPPTSDEIQKLYQRGQNGENTNQIYRSQLAASLRAFNNKDWAPLKPQDTETTFFRCRPVVGNEKQPAPARASTPQLKQRPKSVPPSMLRVRSSQPRANTPGGSSRPGRFDTLSPFILADLIADAETSPTPIIAPDRPMIDDMELDPKYRDDDELSMSSRSSMGSNSEAETDTDSDFEPEVDPNADIPDLNLRPEKLDAIYVPEPKRGWRRFDFDMSNIDIPPYEFQNPFPDSLEDLDLSEIAKNKQNWRQHVKNKSLSKEENLEGVLDRVVEMEKLQMDTMEWENKRAIQSQMRKAAVKRGNSARLKDRKCCTTCLQPTCFGDCPEKVLNTNICEICREVFCTGTCEKTKYENRMRQPRLDDALPIRPRTPLPRACTSCQKKHNAKLINANNLILGQPRLNNVTYSRGQSSQKVKDPRPKSESSTYIPNNVVREFEKLNLEPRQPSRPGTATSRPRSRNSLYPGKSFNSQRRDSISESERASSAQGSNRKKRAKSTKQIKRPKTAL